VAAGGLAERRQSGEEYGRENVLNSFHSVRALLADSAWESKNYLRG
jgi:hypothetical protein